MRNLLQELNRHPGIRGSALVAQDGMIVAGALPPDVQEDVVSALVSFLVTTTHRALAEAEYQPFSDMLLTATHGRVLLLGLGPMYLVVVTDQFADLAVVTVEAQSAAQRIQRATRMNV